VSIEVKLIEEIFESCNILKVQAGTNCPMGGDSGHGGRTVLRIMDMGGSDIRVGINGAAAEPVQSIEIVLGGDCEHDTFVDALDFALRVLSPRSAAYLE